MAQPTNRVLTPTAVDSSDYRNQYVEVVTDATDYATADSSLVLSTLPFLAIGNSFSDIPLFPVGICQSFQYNEGLAGQFMPEIGSSRKLGASGTSTGSGMISRLSVHGNSLVAALYRPTLIWIAKTDTLSDVVNRLAGTDQKWIQGLNTANDLNLFSADVDDYVTKVIAPGGMNAGIYKVPFGLIEIRRDVRQRVTAINYLEQCILLGDQNGLQAGQFQIVEGMSFSYERRRPLKAVGPFSLSEGDMIGAKEALNNPDAE